MLSLAILFLGLQLCTSSEILSGSTYSKLPLKKEFLKNYILHQTGRLITLDDGNHLVHRHLDQIKVVPDTPKTSLETTMMPEQKEQNSLENDPQEELEAEHNVVDNIPTHLARSKNVPR